MDEFSMENVASMTIETCALAGKIMLQSGAETSRVEDTMNRIAASTGVRAQSFVMPTGIVFSAEDAKWTKLIRIAERSTNLHKIIEVNQVSRALHHGQLSVESAFRALVAIEHTLPYYRTFVRVLFAALTSGSFLFMFGGAWPNFFPAALVGGLGYATLLLVHRFAQLKFFSELAAAFVVGLLASVTTIHGQPAAYNVIVISSLMPLVPGILITNAVRDLMAGHLVSGISKGAEAALTAFAIGAGIAAAIQIL